MAKSDRDELLKLQICKEVKEQSDKDYAIKLVENVVWGLVGLMMTGVILALLRLILK